MHRNFDIALMEILDHVLTYHISFVLTMSLFLWTCELLGWTAIVTCYHEMHMPFYVST